MYSHGLGSPRRSSQIEIPDSRQNSPKNCANPSRYTRTYPQHTPHEQMANQSVPISGWNSTYGSGATKDKMTGTSGFQLQNTPIICGQVKQPRNPHSILSW